MSSATASALPASPFGAGIGVDADIDPRKLVGFLAMVFGMFMAILDIQIVSASLTEIQAGLAASNDEISWVQTAYLIAESLPFRFPASCRVRSARASCSRRPPPALPSRASCVG